MANGELPEEYREFLKQNVNWLERLGDALTGVDERVDYLVKQLAGLKLSEETITKLTEAVEKLEEMGVTVPKRTEQVTFAERLAPLAGLKQEANVPMDGIITSVLFNFPPGCYDPVTGNYLADMAFGHGEEQICPSEGTLALSGATPVFPISQKVKENDTLWAILENADGLNPHGVSIIATIVGG